MMLTQGQTAAAGRRVSGRREREELFRKPPASASRRGRRTRRRPSHELRLLPGCSLDGTAKDFTRSTLAVAAAGPGAARDGGLDLLRLHRRPHSDPLLALRPAGQEPARGQGATTVAVACAACFSRLKMANHHIAGDAGVRGPGGRGARRRLRRPDARAAPAGDPGRRHRPRRRRRQRSRSPLEGLKVACYYGCLLSRPPEVMQFDDAENPTFMDQLLEAAGADRGRLAAQDRVLRRQLLASPTSAIVLELDRRDPLHGQGRGRGLHRHRLPAVPAQPGHAAEGHRSASWRQRTTCRSSTSRSCWVWPWAAPPRSWAWAAWSWTRSRCWQPKDCLRARPADERRQDDRAAQTARPGRNDRGRRGRRRGAGRAAPASPASRPRSTWPSRGFKVYLVDSSPAIGGRMAQLDKTFPTGDCAMCILSPKLVECARNKNIEIITLADVEGISRRAGQLPGQAPPDARASSTPSKCNACGDCVEACPVDAAQRVRPRAGHAQGHLPPYPQAIPNVFGISKADGHGPVQGRLPRRRQRAGLCRPDRRGQVQGSLRPHPRALPPAGRLRPRLPASLRDASATARRSTSPSRSRDLKRFAADYVYAHRDKPDRSPAGAAARRRWPSSAAAPPD